MLKVKVIFYPLHHFFLYILLHFQIYYKHTLLFKQKKEKDLTPKVSLLTHNNSKGRAVEH